MTTSPVPEPRRRLSTGVFSVNNARSALLPEELAKAAQEFVEQRSAAVLLLPTCSSPARSAVISATQLDLSMTYALTEWLGSMRQSSVVAVPQHLRRAMRCFRAVMLPIATPVLHLGSLVVPAPVNLQETTRVLESLTADFALRLDASQRRELLDHFADVDASASEPSSGTRPKVSAIPTSRRSA
jgi:hypothetical protein